MEKDFGVIEIPDARSKAGHRRRINYKVLDNGCWVPLLDMCTVNGYPTIKWKTKNVALCRYVFVEVAGNTIRKGDRLYHSCENRACLNPEHMVLKEDCNAFEE